MKKVLAIIGIVFITPILLAGILLTVMGFVERIYSMAFCGVILWGLCTLALVLFKIKCFPAKELPNYCMHCGAKLVKRRDVCESCGCVLNETKTVNQISKRSDSVMNFFDIFKTGKIKDENIKLRQELENLYTLLTPEMQEALKLEEHIRQLNFQIDDKNTLIETHSAQLDRIISEINHKKELLVDIDEQLLYQDFALYNPKYDLVNSDEYKVRITKIRDTQKQIIKAGTAVTGNMNWTVNNSAVQGKKMVSDMQKLLLRAFNSECDEIINKVTYSNIELSVKRIRTSCEAVSKLGKIMNIAITSYYENAKIEELYLCYEYQLAKQKEKEEQKELRAQMREEAKLQKEIEEARRKVEKEQQHYQKALINILAQLECASDEERNSILQKKSEIEAQLVEIDKNIKDIDYREANARAGYVYIISNIGAFGENIYKIGMTRRLEPFDRIDELSDASVPFNFDVHAMIFSADAPALENALHKAFENKKLNMVNHRREFFAVTLEEIKEVVKQNYDKSVEFIEIAPAQQYRESLKIKETL